MRTEKKLVLPGGRTLHLEVWRCNRKDRDRQNLPFSLFDFGAHAQLARRDFGWAASFRVGICSCGIYIGCYRHSKKVKE